MKYKLKRTAAGFLYSGLFFVVSLLLFSSCASYTERIAKMQDYYNTGSYEEAKTAADNLLEKAGEKDANLLLLERGKISFASGDNNSAIKDFSIAEQNLLNLEGTYSVTEQAGSMLRDDTVKAYEANGFEQTMISPYLALAYLNLGKKDAALVERRRTINKITQYIERSGADYLENPFSRLVSAMLYLSEGKADDARIEFKKLNSLAGAKGFPEDNAAISKLIGASALCVFVENGRAPIKKEMSDKAITPDGNVVSVVWPVYEKRGTSADYNELYVNGDFKGRTKILFDLQKVILDHFRTEDPKIKARAIARALAKYAVQAVSRKTADKSSSDTVKTLGFLADAATKVSAAAERADTRSWLTMPAEIQYLIIEGVGEGTHSLRVVAKTASGAVLGEITREIKIGKVEKKLEHFIISK